MSSVKIEGNASGTGIFTLASPNSNTNRTLTLPDNTGTIVTTGSSTAITQSMIGTGVAGTGPAFSAWQSSAQTFSNAVLTKVNFQTEEFDTNNNFASSTFTPTVAGYYQVSTSIYFGNTNGFNIIIIFKNGSDYKRLNTSPATANSSSGGGSCIVYCNGTTDYIEVYGYQSQGSSLTIPFPQSDLVWFQGVLARGA